MKNGLRILLGLVFFFACVSFVQAAPSVVVNNPPSTATIGDNIVLNIVLSNFAPSSQYYSKFRIGPTTSSLNDGETFNNLSWYSDSSEYSNFPVITLDVSGNASFQFTGRAKASLAQPGANFFKIRMALASNTSNQEDSQGYSITLSPAPTPTPTPSPTPTSTPTPTPVPSDTPTPTIKPTSSPTPTKTPATTPSPTPIKLAPISTPTKVSTPTLNLTSESSSDSATLGAVLGISVPTATPTPAVTVEGSKKLLPLAIAAALVGMGLAILSGVLVWQKRQGMIGEKKEV